jgi:nicotinate-nucleotide adenylyltransferase
MKKEKYGVFGGSFDPITKEHVNIGVQLVEKGYLDIVDFMPCYTSLHGKSLVDGHHRIKMIDIALDNEKCDALLSNSYEIDKKLSGRTVDLLEDITNAVDKSIECYFIIGMDNALNIHRFSSWERISEMVSVIVLNRPNQEPLKGDEWFMKSPHVYAHNIVTNDVSSTVIRDCIVKSDGSSKKVPNDFFTKYCDPEVFQYIFEHNLYR